MLNDEIEKKIKKKKLKEKIRVNHVNPRYGL